MGRKRKEITHVCEREWSFPRFFCQDLIREDDIRALVESESPDCYCYCYEEGEGKKRPHYHVYLKTCKCKIKEFVMKLGLPGGNKSWSTRSADEPYKASHLIGYILKEQKYACRGIPEEVMKQAMLQAEKYANKKTESHLKNLTRIIKSDDSSGDIIYKVISYFRMAKGVISRNMVDGYVYTFLLKHNNHFVKSEFRRVVENYNLNMLHGEIARYNKDFDKEFRAMQSGNNVSVPPGT